MNIRDCASVPIMEGEGTRISYIEAPEKMPAPPSPATARPMMKTREDGAAAQTREPAAKTRRELRKTALTGRRLYSCPKARIVEASAKILWGDHAC